MKFFYLFLAVIINSVTYGATRMPCQLIDFNEVIDAALPQIDSYSAQGISSNAIKNQINLLQQCVKKYAVCIAERPPATSVWLSRELKSPLKDNFDPVKRELAFGLVQYIDKKTGDLICSISQNNNVQAVPWFGSSWVIGKGLVKKYEIWDAHFNTVMTPKSLYDAFLISHQESVKDKHWIKSYNFTEPKD